VAAYRVGSAPALGDWKTSFRNSGASCLTPGIEPSPCSLVTRPVEATPGWAAVEVSETPASDARRCSSKAKSRLASLLFP